MGVAKRILITGASGNLGTALLRRLGDEDDILAVVRRRPNDGSPYDKASWHELDISVSESTAHLDRLMAGVDTVVHLVWAFQPTRDPDYLARVGPQASRRVLDAAQRAGVSHFVHMSSVGAYAPRVDDRAVTESFPHTGMPTSDYSVHKSRFEKHLDDFETDHPAGMTVTRVRPGIVLQRDAGAALGRYGLPAYLPARLLRALPVLPLDRAFSVPVVHSDDLADAVVRMIERGAGGPFNVAHDEPMTRADVAAVLGARPVHVPARALRGATDIAWRLHLQPLSPGWLDLAFAVPMQDSARAHRELGWRPATGPREALAEAVAGIVQNTGLPSPALRPRSALDRLRALVREGPVSSRRRP